MQKETSVYALKAALEETALLRFTYAMEYFSIAELTVGDEISSVCHLLNCVRDVLSLFERLEAENKKSIFMFIKDAQHIVFGNITRKFKNMLSIEMPLERISSLSSVSTYSDISSSDADIVEEYALMKCRLEKKFDSLVCKQGECDELCEVCEYTAPVFKTKPVACCTIS